MAPQARDYREIQAFLKTVFNKKIVINSLIAGST
jgi:hypothetical protein